MTTTRWVDHRVATDIQQVLRWVTELTGVDFPPPSGRSTVTDHELIAAARALADDARAAVMSGPGGAEVEHALRTLLGLTGSDPEAYRDEIAPDDVRDT